MLCNAFALNNVKSNGIDDIDHVDVMPMPMPLPMKIDESKMRAE